MLSADEVLENEFLKATIEASKKLTTPREHCKMCFCWLNDDKFPHCMNGNRAAIDYLYRDTDDCACKVFWYMPEIKEITYEAE